MKKPEATDFSDSAKRRAGVEPFDLAAEIKTLKAAALAAAETNQADGERVRERIRDAIRAFDEQRRGDGMAILRALVRRIDGKLTPSSA